MRIKVEYLGYIKNLINKRIEEFELPEGSSLSKLLLILSEKYGKPFKKEVYEPGLSDLKYGFVATINGILTDQLGGMNALLRNGDHVILMSLMSGG